MATAVTAALVVRPAVCVTAGCDGAEDAKRYDSRTDRQSSSVAAAADFLDHIGSHFSLGNRTHWANNACLHRGECRKRNSSGGCQD